MRHLKGIKFPTDKQTIIDHVRGMKGKEGMPDTDQVSKVVEQISDKQYSTPAEILKEVGKIE